MAAGFRVSLKTDDWRTGRSTKVTYLNPSPIVQQPSFVLFPSPSDHPSLQSKAKEQSLTFYQKSNDGSICVSSNNSLFSISRILGSRGPPHPLPSLLGADQRASTNSDTSVIIIPVLKVISVEKKITCQL